MDDEERWGLSRGGIAVGWFCDMEGVWFNVELGRELVCSWALPVLYCMYIELLMISKGKERTGKSKNSNACPTGLKAATSVPSHNINMNVEPHQQNISRLRWTFCVFLPYVRHI